MSFWAYLLYDVGYSKTYNKSPLTKEFCYFLLGIGLDCPVEMLCMVDILWPNMMKSPNIFYDG